MVLFKPPDDNECINWLICILRSQYAPNLGNVTLWAFYTSQKHRPVSLLSLVLPPAVWSNRVHQARGWASSTLTGQTSG